MSQEESKKEITKEEFEEYRKITMEQIDMQLPLMRKQNEYQLLLTEMEEYRARYLRAQQMIVNIAAPPPEPKPESKERTLKKEPV